MNDEQSLYKPMRIIPYHISIFLTERDKDEYEAFIEADSGAGTTATLWTGEIASSDRHLS
jgi:hypothetical protein